MRKLIEKKQESLVVCDNPDCDFTIPYNENENNLIAFVDVPCPLCGENLLTKEDFLLHYKMMKIVDRLNKWFSWITIFYPKSKNQTVRMHFHDGVQIKHEPNRSKSV